MTYMYTPISPSPTVWAHEDHQPHHGRGGPPQVPCLQLLLQRTTKEGKLSTQYLSTPVYTGIACSIIDVHVHVHVECIV